MTNKPLNEQTTNNTIAIITQAFYGNRTGTTIKAQNVKKFLLGYVDDDLSTSPGELESMNVEYILVPNSDNIAIVYDKHAEDEYINVSFPETYERDGAEYLARWGEELKPHITCEIPEFNFKLYTRCFACRINECGELQSLQENDYLKFIDFFPAR